MWNRTVSTNRAIDSFLKLGYVVEWENKGETALQIKYVFYNFCLSNAKKPGMANATPASYTATALTGNYSSAR